MFKVKDFESRKLSEWWIDVVEQSKDYVKEVCIDLNEGSHWRVLSSLIE